ncbi:MAG: hypothetical protein NTV86_07005, partial [Planctomycetota bacterium]|nr:hypothetical protein [Planctomycetota bacterium]
RLCNLVVKRLSNAKGPRVKDDNSQATAQTADAVETLPRRRRMRWWGWLLTILGTLLCMAVSAWFGWGAVGQRRLDELAAEIRSRGEPLDWKDLAGPPVPDDQNAVSLYVRAGEELSGPKGRYSAADVERLMELLENVVGDPTFRREHRAEVAQLLEIARDSLALLPQAAARPSADFGTDFRDSAANWKLPRLSGILRLANVSALWAVEAHEAGREAEALTTVGHVLRLARCMGRGPGVICNLVSMHIGRQAMEALEQMVSRPPAAPLEPASARQARAVIADLLDEAPARQAWRQALMIERSSQYDIFERMRRGETVLWGQEPFRQYGIPTWVTGPLLAWGELHCVKATTSLLEGAKETTYPAALRKMDDGPDSYQALRRLAQEGEGSLAYRVAFILFPAIDVDVHYEHLARRRLAATGLAMRLYELEKGKPVAALADLVAGGYLKAVPADPFSNKGEPICLKADPKQPLLYSVGKNGLDEDGAFTLDADGRVSRDSPDVVFFLHGDRPAGKVIWREPKRPATSATKPRP